MKMKKKLHTNLHDSFCRGRVGIRKWTTVGMVLRFWSTKLKDIIESILHKVDCTRLHYEVASNVEMYVWVGALCVIPSNRDSIRNR